MRKPKNPGGVIFALGMLAFFLASAFFVDLSTPTRYGVPYRYLFSVGVAVSIYFLWRGWTKRRGEGD